jgi:hypothetical protein
MFIVFILMGYLMTGGVIVVFVSPASFVREIYHDDKKPSRWHIPIVDRRSWLCLDVPNLPPPDYLE